MKKGIFILAIIGIVGMTISLIGVFFSITNDGMITSLYSFMGFSLLACSVLFIDKKQEEKRLRELDK
jgi:predicted Co/Zn/Cd cation transporter (cation efflux family)